MSVPSKPEEIEKLAEAGCTRAMCWVPTAGRGPIEAKLERWEAAIAEFHGEA